MSDHPLVAQSRERLAAIERRTPPGYPLAYNLHYHKFVCTGCGAQASFATLTTVDRAGASSKSYHMTGTKEKIYDLPVDEVTSHYVTPRCERCITALPRETVPALPPLRQRIGHSHEKELDLDDFGGLMP
jgi:hypothetical protein